MKTIFGFLNSLIFKTVYAIDPEPPGAGGGAAAAVTEDKVRVTGLQFTIPSLSQVLTFVIRFFFVIAGLAALLFLILGALAWVTSAGEKEKVNKAQEKIQAAVVGLVVLVAVLALMVTIEQFVFAGKVCFGISCDMHIPQLLQ